MLGAGVGLGLGLGLPYAPLKGVGGYPALLAALTAWETDQVSSRIEYGGKSSFAGTGTLTGSASAPGRTFVLSSPVGAIRQDGYIRKITANVSEVGATGSWKFKLFRPSGNDFVQVAETEAFTPGGTGSRNFFPATPLGPCEPGDRLGVWLRGGVVSTRAVILTGAQTGANLRYAAGDLTTILSTDTEIADTGMEMFCLGIAPFAVASGDSNAEGHPLHHSVYHQGPSGDPANEPLNQVRSRVPTFTYQNYAETGDTWADAAAKTSVIDARGSSIVNVHCGVNDVVAARAWVDIEADMDTYLAGLTAGQTLFVNEVMPGTAATDLQAAAIRDLNANYETWCTTNGVILIRCHDAMGQLRDDTGELDDLNPAYDQGDGWHLSLAGADRLGAIIAQAMNGYFQGIA